MIIGTNDFAVRLKGSNKNLEESVYVKLNVEKPCLNHQLETTFGCKLTACSHGSILLHFSIAASAFRSFIKDKGLVEVMNVILRSIFCHPKISTDLPGSGWSFDVDFCPSRLPIEYGRGQSCSFQNTYMSMRQYFWRRPFSSSKWLSKRNDVQCNSLLYLKMLSWFWYTVWYSSRARKMCFRFLNRKYLDEVKSWHVGDK